MVGTTSEAVASGESSVRAPPSSGRGRLDSDAPRPQGDGRPDCRAARSASFTSHRAGDRHESGLQAETAAMASRTTPRPLALVPTPDAGAEADATGLDLDWHPLMLAAALHQERGSPESWRSAPRHDGLGTAVVDAIMSPRVSSSTVERVVERFTRRFGDGDVDALSQSFTELGREGWRAELGTNHRVMPRPEAAYKSDVIASAATVLHQNGVHSCQDALARAHDVDLRAAWCALPGQSSGFTWRHLLLVAGLSEPLVCPLTRRFARRHLGRPAAGAPAGDLITVMTRTAGLLEAGVLDVDHQMWRAALKPSSRRTMR